MPNPKLYGSEVEICLCVHYRMMESADAIDDSDDEVDYTKMDQGNKKGPVGRWDFDTQEDYSNYMSTKEALPKYAFHSLVHITAGEVKHKSLLISPIELTRSLMGSMCHLLSMST